MAQGFVIHWFTSAFKARFVREIAFPCMFPWLVSLGLSFFHQFDFKNSRFLAIFAFAHVLFLGVAYQLLPNTSVFLAYLAGLFVLGCVIFDVQDTLNRMSANLTTDDYVLVALRVYLSFIRQSSEMLELAFKFAKVILRMLFKFA